MTDMPTDTSADDPQARAVLLVADAIGELMGFWNFKPSMGRVWTALYLSAVPLSADEIAGLTQLSAGSVSMTIQDLLGWGVIRRAWVQGERRRHYEAETDILSMVTRVFQQRELRWIESVVDKLQAAQSLLADAPAPRGKATRDDQRFVAGRIANLLVLARAGRRVVEHFTQAGTLDLRSLRDTLGQRRRPG